MKKNDSESAIGVFAQGFGMAVIDYLHWMFVVWAANWAFETNFNIFKVALILWWVSFVMCLAAKDRLKKSLAEVDRR